MEDNMKLNRTKLRKLILEEVFNKQKLLKEANFENVDGDDISVPSNAMPQPAYGPRKFGGGAMDDQKPTGRYFTVVRQGRQSDDVAAEVIKKVQEFDFARYSMSRAYKLDDGPKRFIIFEIEESKARFLGWSRQ